MTKQSPGESLPYATQLLPSTT